MNWIKSCDKKKVWEVFCILVLLLYPLRHIWIGLDFWDTGYSYANFRYMGMDHMDPMWLFSTFLSNVVGHILTMLPGGQTLLGMNFYTGLVAAGLAIMGYFFCTRQLKIPSALVFLGEFIALSLCWCPTGILYNYITYVFFLGGVICLYQGLAHKKKLYLFVAGICLGINVFVRFSNLAEAAMIVGVWAYAVIEGMEVAKEQDKVTIGKGLKFIWGQIWRNTLWCLGGYLVAVGLMLGYICMRYGAEEYITGIMRLFSMTEGATDYKPTSMVYSLFETYIKNLYWFVRICIFVVIAFLGYLAGRALLTWKVVRERVLVSNIIKGLMKIGCFMVGAVMLLWLYKGAFFNFDYYEYGSMLLPGIVFLMITLLVTVCKVLAPKVKKEEKLISGIIFLVIILTSLGSNNGVYPSLNNLFIAAPYMLWQFWQFCISCRGISMGKLVLEWFPVKVIAGMLLLLVIGQSIGFGAHFVFQETHGARETMAKVENNSVLAGIRMSEERARWMEELSEYVHAQGLQGQEVILFGQIPSLSFYLQMPSSFNPWSDLRSYTYDSMKSAMDELIAQVDGGKRAPVVMVERAYLEQEEKYNADKWQLIVDYMEMYDYQLSFYNEKFVIYER